MCSLSSFFNPTHGAHTVHGAISCSSGTASLEKISIGPKKSKGPGFFAALAGGNFDTRVPPGVCAQNGVGVKTKIESHFPKDPPWHGDERYILPTFISLIFISEILGKYKPFRPMDPYLVGG